MRFEAITIMVTGEYGKRTTHYTEQIKAAAIDLFTPIVNRISEHTSDLPIARDLPPLRVKWTPHPDGAAVASFYAGPEEMDLITTCVLLPRGKEDALCIAETLQVFLNRPPFFMSPDLSLLPDRPCLVAVPWPNIKHLAAMTIVGDAEVCLAAAHFLQQRHRQN